MRITRKRCFELHRCEIQQSFNADRFSTTFANSSSWYFSHENNIMNDWNTICVNYTLIRDNPTIRDNNTYDLFFGMFKMNKKKCCFNNCLFFQQRIFSKNDPPPAGHSFRSPVFNVNVKKWCICVEKTSDLILLICEKFLKKGSIKYHLINMSRFSCSFDIPAGSCDTINVRSSVDGLFADAQFILSKIRLV